MEQYLQRGKQWLRPLLVAGIAATPAWCQAPGTIDTSGFKTVIGAIVGLVLALGAFFVIREFVLAFQAWRGNETKEIMNHFLGGLIGGVIVGFATVWTASLTGINIVAQNIFG